MTASRAMLYKQLPFSGQAEFRLVLMFYVGQIYKLR